MFSPSQFRQFITFKCWETEVLQSSDASTNQAAMSQMIAEVTQKMKSEFEGLTIDLEPKTRNKRNITAAESDSRD